MPGPIVFPSAADLPEDLQELHAEFGAWWELDYVALCRLAPYVARPRYGSGRAIRADSPRLLAAVLDRLTPPANPEHTP